MVRQKKLAKPAELRLGTLFFLPRNCLKWLRNSLEMVQEKSEHLMMIRSLLTGSHKISHDHLQLRTAQRMCQTETIKNSSYSRFASTAQIIVIYIRKGFTIEPS